MNAPLPSPLLEVQQNTGPALLLFVDASGVPVAVNRSARQFLLQKEQFRWIDIIHGDDLSGWEAKLAEALGSQTQLSGWFRLRRFDNAIRQFVVRAEPRYDIQGTFTGYLVSGLDVTDLGREVSYGPSSPESSIPINAVNATSGVQELAQHWHSALVKDATVLKGASELLRDYLSTASDNDPSRIKALTQVEDATAAICNLVSELNRRSREA